MSDKDIVEQEPEKENDGPVNPIAPREADDPFAQQDMPLALLEFHSPTASLVNMPPSPAALYIMWVVGGLFIMCFLAAALFPMNKIVTTPGRLVSVERTIIVQPLETSIVRSVDVNMGDVVQKGQILAHLDPTITTADIGDKRAQRDAYQATVNRLKAEAEGKEYTADIKNPYSVNEAAAFLKRRLEFAAKTEQYEQEIASLQSQIQGYVASAAMYRGRANIGGQILEMRQKLQKEAVGSRLMTLGAQGELIDAERAQIEAQQNANAARAKLAATQQELAAYKENWLADVYAKLSEAQHRYDEAEAEFTKSKLRSELILLRAPEDGVVLNVAKLSVGAVVQGAQVLVSLVPTGAALEMEAVLRGQDAGFVKLGDHALLKFSTFPYNQYGGADATVRVISADTFSSEDAPQDVAGAAGRGQSPQSMANGFYRVRLRIDRYTLHGVPSFFHPIPGMPVTANIQVGKRTMLQYFFNRLTAATSSGLREPS